VERGQERRVASCINSNAQTRASRFSVLHTGRNGASFVYQVSYVVCAVVPKTPFVFDKRGRGVRIKRQQRVCLCGTANSAHVGSGDTLPGKFPAFAGRMRASTQHPTF
jgi:hypothetical protein